MDPAPPPARQVVGRGTVIAAFGAVVLAGLLGATIGVGLVNVSVEGDQTVWQIVGAVIGAAAGAGGVAIVAVLVLRAMNEWNTHQARAPRPPAPSDAPPRRSRS